MADGRHFGNRQTRYLHNCLTDFSDFDEMWYGDAYLFFQRD